MTEGQFRDRLTYDPARGEYRDGAIRYMMIRPDALMGMIAEMPEEARVHAMEAFGRAIRRAGGHSARTYRDAGSDDLLRTIAGDRAAARLGRLDAHTHGGRPRAFGAEQPVRGGRRTQRASGLRADPRHAERGRRDAAGRGRGDGDGVRRHGLAVLHVQRSRSPIRTSSGSTVSMKYGSSFL